MTDLDRILARLERLETDNAALRRQLDEQGDAHAGATAPVAAPMSRRGLLRRAGTGAAAVGIGAVAASLGVLSQPGEAKADGETVTVGGTFETAVKTTLLHNTVNDFTVLEARNEGAGAGVYGISEKGFGVQGFSRSSDAVHGFGYITGVHGVSSFGGTGVLGTSDTGAAVKGESVHGYAFAGVSQEGSAVVGEADTDGTGVEGESNFGMGVYGVSSTNTGVLGASGNQPVPSPSSRANVGVMGLCATGRGGVFISDHAQVRLMPSTAKTHPATGLRGDLFVDKAGRLWFCKGGTSWRQLV
jgi:hypothetical protein